MEIITMATMATAEIITMGIIPIRTTIITAEIIITMGIIPTRTTIITAEIITMEIMSITIIWPPPSKKWQTLERRL
jgi:hypothetical protein